MSAHEAAVRAVAGSYHAEWKAGCCAHVGKWHQCTVFARSALAALATDPDVRAALADDLDFRRLTDNMGVGRLKSACLSRFLDALAPPEAP